MEGCWILSTSGKADGVPGVKIRRKGLPLLCQPADKMIHRGKIITKTTWKGTTRGTCQTGLNSDSELHRSRTQNIVASVRWR